MMMGSSWLLMGLALAGAQNSTCPGDLVWNDCGTLCENTCGAEAATFCSFVCVAACQCPPHLPWRHDAASNSCYADADSCQETHQSPSVDLQYFSLVAFVQRGDGAGWGNGPNR